MTDSQWQVMQMLEKSPRETTKSTHHGFVSGAVVTSLVAKGWAKRAPGMGIDKVSITPKGILALLDERIIRDEKDRAAARRVLAEVVADET